MDLNHPKEQLTLPSHKQITSHSLQSIKNKVYTKASNDSASQKRSFKTLKDPASHPQTHPVKHTVQSILSTRINTHLKTKPPNTNSNLPVTTLNSQQNLHSCFAPYKIQIQKRFKRIQPEPSPLPSPSPRPSKILQQMIAKSYPQNGRVINILHILKQGPKYSLKQSFIPIYSRHPLDKELKDNIKQSLKIEDRYIYLFHLNKEPIHQLLEIHHTECSVFVGTHPKLEIPEGLYQHLREKVDGLERVLRNAEQNWGCIKEARDEVLYVDDYVDQLVKQPLRQLEIETDSKCLHRNISKQYSNILEWYQKQLSSCNTPTKHRSSVSSSSKQYPSAVQTSAKLQHFKYISNPHKHKPTLNIWQKKPLILKSKSLVQTKSTKKDAPKHSLLSSQNIPYMIQKYNNSRYNIHYFYNIYKSLVRISVQRKKVGKEGGVIDRDTFDAGLNGVEFNISKSVVDKICQSEEYISWPQFLKIMSVSTSNTPQQKFNYILDYVSQQNQSQYLSKSQIDVMITTCLKKILDKAEPLQFLEMKDYVLEEIFKELDPENFGRILIERLRERVLSKSQENDLISFLFVFSC